MNKEQAQELLTKNQQGLCTPEEKALLDRWYLQEAARQPMPEAPLDPSLTEQLIWNRIMEELPAEPKVRRLKKWHTIGAAATVLIFLSLGLYFALNKSTVIRQQVNNNNLQNHIVPGGNKALLTLSDGSKITLDNAKNGVITQQGNAAVNKTRNGELVYTHDLPDMSLNVPVVFNTISTPRGGEYKVVLPDGTQVWLNAASSIKFPTTFPGKIRRVEITGEVYFEVAKNKNMPFKVFANGAEVEVLGTHFDVMAYQDEPELKATLLEGAVKFRKNNSEVLLKPGQQAVVSNTSQNIMVQQANIDGTMAWRNGYFIFQDESIESIMRKVSRWYDVDIAYGANMADKEYGGKVSRYKNISDLLKTLELTGTIHFKIEGRRVTVMQ